LVGEVTDSVPAPLEKYISIRRCSESNACVFAPFRIRMTLLMLAAFGVVTVNPCP
jgi:hypothetical protein